jgi:hypothetical protein
MKKKLTVTALALGAACWVYPAGAATAAQNGAHASGSKSANAVRCQVRRHGRWHTTNCNGVVASNTASKAANTTADPPAPPPPPPPPPVVAAAPPAPVLTIPDNLLQPVSNREVNVGVLWLGGHNTNQYGRYNGFTTNGLHFLLGFDVENRDGWNTGDTHYFNVSGLNLDIQTGSHLTTSFRDNAYTSATNNKLGPNAEIDLNFGAQGSWGVNANYDATSYTGNIISSLWTVNNGIGYLNNNMLPFGGASNNPLTKGTVTSWNTATLTPKFNQFQTGTRRDKVELGGHYEMGEWMFASDIQHEHKQGSLEESVRETYGGMPFTLPVDYDTDRFDASATYVDPDLQVQIHYTYSHFTDNNLGVTLPYVVSISALSASSGPYAQQAFYSTPPSNSAHYVTAMVSDKLAPKTKITFNGRIGLELQDSQFPPNSADPNLSSTLGNPTYTWFQHLNSSNQGTTDTSLHGRAFVYEANASFVTELADHLEGRLVYSLDGRDVSVSQYQVWMGAASIDAQANSAFYVVPQGWVKQNGTAELTYLVLPESSTKITASYTFNNTTRTNAQVTHSQTNTLDVNVTSMIGTAVLARLSFEHGNRAGTLLYGIPWGNLETGVPDPDNTPSGAYYQAPMVSDSVIARADYAPGGDFSGGVYLKYADNRYHYPTVPTAPTFPGDPNWTLTGRGEGLNRDYTFTVGPSARYQPNDHFNVNVFYTYEKIFFDNYGNGACAQINTGNCLGSAGYFRNTYSSAMHTAGLSSDWNVTDKFKLSGEYNLSMGSVIFGEFNGVMVPSVTQSYQNVTPYPDINSTMHDLKMEATYQFADNIEGSLIYRYSMFNNNDWQYVPVPAIATTNTGTAISILNAGYGSPNYNVSSVGMVMRMKL